MKKLVLFSLLSLMVSATAFEGCTNKYGSKSKGRQQPKKGPMPCPMKDC